MYHNGEFPTIFETFSPTTVDRANCRVLKSLYTGEFPTIFETTADKRIAEYRSCITMANFPPSLGLFPPQLLIEQIAEYGGNCITMASSPPSLRFCSPQLLMEQIAEYTSRLTLTSSTPFLRLCSPTTVDRANCRVHKSLYTGEFPAIFGTSPVIVFHDSCWRCSCTRVYNGSVQR